MATKNGTDLLVENYTPHAVRFPQALSLDFDALRDAFGNNQSIVTDLIIYLSQVKKRDLFNKIRFTGSDFGKTMGYSPSTLKRNEQNFDKKNLPMLKGHICDGLLEYTLFSMGRTNLTFNQNYKGKFKAEFIQLITNLEIHNNDKPNSKRVYEVTPSDFLLYAIFREFFILNIDDYVKAGKLNSKDRKTSGAGKNLYMSLIKGLHYAVYNKQQGFEPIFTTNVDKLSFACGFDMNREPKDRKKAIKTLLEKFQELEHLKFSYEFFNKNDSNSRILYDIKIMYSEESLRQYESAQESRFYNQFYVYLENKYLSLYPEYKNVKDGFSKWLINPNFDKGHKIALLKSVYRDVYNATLDDTTCDNYLKNGIEKNSWRIPLKMTPTTEEESEEAGN